MKREFDINQLTAMKPQFLAWLEAHWCTCPDDRIENAATTHYPIPVDDESWLNATHHRSDGHPCVCYGPTEYDDVHLATIDDEAVVIHYHERTLTLPFDDDDFPPDECDDALPLFNRRLGGEPFITHGDLQWVGDDCDYYGPIVRWLASLTE